MGFELRLPECTWFHPEYRLYRLSVGFWVHITTDETVDQLNSPLLKESPSLQYEPLSKDRFDIRLFTLHPGSFNDPLSGRLEHQTLSYKANPKYEALSYCWGDPTEASVVQVNDTTTAVTKSLETALRYLRFLDRPRALWIDYLCINQSDVEERSREVANMGCIYDFAESVIIWLGPPSAVSPLGMRILNSFATEKRPRHDAEWQILRQMLVRSGLQDIMARPWFTRMWVAQEAGLSKHTSMTCGHDTAKWTSWRSEQFLRMIKYAELLPMWAQQGLDAVDMRPLLEVLDLQVRQKYDKPRINVSDRGPADVLDMAHAIRGKGCSDPRDKIFGILGMLGNHPQLDIIKPDYSLTVEQVFEQLAQVAFPSSEWEYIPW